MSATGLDAGKETPDQALTRAQTAAQAKRFGEAAGICQDVLQANPTHPGALALLGVIAAHTNQPERAIDFIERAIKQQSNVPAWYANLCSLVPPDELSDGSRFRGSGGCSPRPKQSG